MRSEADPSQLWRTINGPTMRLRSADERLPGTIYCVTKCHIGLLFALGSLEPSAPSAEEYSYNGHEGSPQPKTSAKQVFMLRLLDAYLERRGGAFSRHKRDTGLSLTAGVCTSHGTVTGLAGMQLTTRGPPLEKDEYDSGVEKGCFNTNRSFSLLASPCIHLWVDLCCSL
jgi:hypothetical protein